MIGGMGGDDNQRASDYPSRALMRIAFIDPSGWDINVETPFVHPLGGTQSAACYLAIEMARAEAGAEARAEPGAVAGAALGHQVYFISNTSSPGMIRGVQCLSTRQFTPAQLP